MDAALIAVGARVYEHLPRMLQAKAVAIDGQWAALAGKTSGGHRLNDASMAVTDAIRSRRMTAAEARAPIRPILLWDRPRERVTFESHKPL